VGIEGTLQYSKIPDFTCLVGNRSRFRKREIPTPLEDIPKSSTDHAVQVYRLTAFTCLTVNLQLYILLRNTYKSLSLRTFISVSVSGCFLNNTTFKHHIYSAASGLSASGHTSMFRVSFFFTDDSKIKEEESSTHSI
jgi:hypothetical protein